MTLSSAAVVIGTLRVKGLQEKQQVKKKSRIVIKTKAYMQLSWLSKLSDEYQKIADLQFYVLFNSMSVISGQWADDNERLCVMEPYLWLRRTCLECGSNLSNWGSCLMSTMYLNVSLFILVAIIF